jgi:uncharacterized damage-inducible protein DinB
MAKKSESETLTDTYEAVRGLTKFFFTKAKDIDVHKRWSIDGTVFNSVYWMAAHLVWTEHMLLVEGLTGKKMDIAWLEDFAMGNEAPSRNSNPTFEEALEKLSEVHDEAVKNIRSLTDEQLEEPNHQGIAFMGKNTKRNIIMHAIRHEPMHVGQLSWILKLNGIKIV